VRAVLPKGEQQRFIETIYHQTGLCWTDIAKVCQVDPKTLRGWRQEKYMMSYEAIKKLHQAFDAPMPTILEIRSEYWHTRKAGITGAKKRYELYGNPGTAEGRRKGGQKSVENRERFPERYGDGFVIRKQLLIPEKSPLLAEFIGIMLGDGSITDHQVTVTLNKTDDAEYANFIRELIGGLFGIASSIHIDDEDNTCTLLISSMNVIDHLLSLGLKKGNKVAQQVDVPDWIFDNEDFVSSCVRGLMDTDGSVYPHKYKVGGRTYCYTKMCFRNHSLPLLASVERMLSSLDFTPKNDGKQVSLYRQMEVKRYFEEIGTNNPKHLKRYQNFSRA